jgi:hypothetical protein
MIPYFSIVFSKIFKIMQYTTVKLIDEIYWSNFVSDTYGKHYRFQQQEGCQNNGSYHLLEVPNYNTDEYIFHDKIHEIVNGSNMGVKFENWLERDPKQHLKNGKLVRDEQWAIDLWWERNFYPCVETVANDLHSRGVLDAGTYIITINW